MNAILDQLLERSMIASNLFILSWGSTLLCFLMCYYGSKGLGWRLSTVVGLLASTWVLVMPSLDGSSHLTSTSIWLVNRSADVGSFLLVFAGALMSREGRPAHRLLDSQHLQKPAMWLLFCLVMARAPYIFGQRLLARAPDMHGIEQYETLLGTGLSLIGLLALVLGAWAIATSLLQFYAIVAVSIAYSLLETVRGVELLLAPAQPLPLSSAHVLGYSVLKLLLTAAVIRTVQRYARYGPTSSPLPA